MNKLFESIDNLFSSDSSVLNESNFYYKEFSGAGEIDYIEFETEQEAEDYAAKVNKETGHETAVYDMSNDECVALFDALDESDDHSLADKPLKDLSREEFKQLLKDKYPNGFHCETNAGDVELSSDGSWANSSNTPNGKDDLIYPFETYDDFCDYFFTDVEEIFGDQTFNDILGFNGTSGMPHFISLNESNDFTDEERENNNLDDEGYDEYGDEWIHCEWCGEATPKYECKKERNLGWICKNCQNALYSRGEKAVYEEPINESDTNAKILDFQETGGGVLSYVGEVGDYNFIGDIDGSVEFIDKKWGIDSWDKYCNIEDEAYSEYTSDEPIDNYKYGKDISGTYDFEQKYAEFKPELLPEVANALESFAKTIHNPDYSYRVFDEVERLRNCDTSLDEENIEEPKKDSKVRVSLYGEVTEYDSIEDAIEEMKTAMSFCDPSSHEFKRYLSVYYQLKDGKTNCTDELVESTISLVKKGLTEDNKVSSAKDKFISYCKGKIKDLGTVQVETDDWDSDEDDATKLVDIKVSCIFNKDVYLLDFEDTVDKLDTDEAVYYMPNTKSIVKSSGQDAWEESVAELNFEAISESLYNYILEYWDDHSFDDYFSTQDAVTKGKDKIESELVVPEPFKYNVVERNGGADVEIYNSDYPDLKASTTTMDKSGNYVQDNFDIDGLWEVNVVDSNGKYKDKEYITGWKDVVKFLQDELSKINK